MIVGCVKEIKNREFRVGMTPDNAKAFILHGHKVIGEKGLGVGAGFSDEQYINAGVDLKETAEEVWGKSDMLIKVKEPLKEEFNFLRNNLIVYTYLHLAADRELTQAMLTRKCKGVAYETLTDEKGNLPLLKPMSEIAGRISIIEGGKCLEKVCGGKGILISGVPGVRPANVVIIGGGVAGFNAARMAFGLGANVSILDISPSRLTQLDEHFQGSIRTLYSTPNEIERQLKNADLVIGAVLIKGAKAPKLVKKEHLKLMEPGSVIVDIAIDQGGCFETSKPTYHDNPTFIIDGVVHYCVANIPGAVPYTSTLALTNATLAYGLKIADLGLEQAAANSPAILSAINVYDGNCTQENVADAFELTYHALEF